MTTRALIVGIAVILSLPGSASWATGDSDSDSTSERLCPDYNPLRNPYVGDLHIHTAFSFDAVLLGVETEPSDAYAFAKGEPIELAPTGPPSTGLPRVTQLERPLDFAAVSDHAEFFGEFHLCTVPGDPAFDAPFCANYRAVAFGNRDVTTLAGPVTLNVFLQFAQPLIAPLPQRNPVCGPGNAECISRASLVWQESQDATNLANDPCSFTAFNAYEWTANTIFPDAPTGANLHRNVIFGGDSVPSLPSSYLEAPRVELLWDQLRQDCIEGDPDCDALTIPHNSNLSAGRMFKPVYSAEPVPAPPFFFADRPLTPEDAGVRASIEPVVEVMQNKGASECRISMRTDDGVPFLGSDELCDFESYDRVGVLDPPIPNVPVPRLSFVREGLKEGLVQEAALGVNPFKLGMLGSTDTHNSTPGKVSETNFAVTGNQGINDFTPQLALSIRNGTGIESNAGALAVVWAEENTREAIFDAIRRKEVYGTSGTRPIVRFFGSWHVGLGLCGSQNTIKIADEKGVPMGADLPVRPGNKKPRFVVTAQQDPLGSPLQRIQIVKGWLDENGEAREAVYEVAGDPDNGASVDVNTCQPQGSGFDSLCTVWEDPDFDGEQRAFYYARVLENPTCRWSQQFCANTFGNVGAACAAGAVPPEFALCCDRTAVPPLDVPQTIQERAWTSPVWYTP